MGLSGVSVRLGACPEARNMDDPDELDRLRCELVRRLEHHPFAVWSAALLRTVITVIDLAQPVPPLQHPTRPPLRLVRPGSRGEGG